MVKVIERVAEFSFYRPKAALVCLVGCFNGGSTTKLAMSRTPDGYWKAHVRLPAGEYRFRYLADGEWFADYASFGLEYGRFGPESIVRVGPCDIRPERSVENPITPALNCSGCANPTARRERIYNAAS